MNSRSGRNEGNITLLHLSLFFFLVFSPATLFAQPSFDIGNSEVAVWNNSGDNPGLTFTVKGLIFDSDLKSTHRFTNVSGGILPISAAWGYEGPWSFDTQAGDIDVVNDTLGCSEYDIEFAGIIFRLNLIDANWGAGSTTSVYRLLIEWDGSDVRIWVRTPGSSGTWSGTYIPVSNGGTYTYWGLVQTAFGGAGYTRERTTYNNKRFHVTGTDDQLPLPSTLVTNARLDVNLDVHVDAFVPYGRTLLIEGFDDPQGDNTTLRFDNATGLTVYGSLRTIETQYGNEWIYFTSSAGSPAAGDWDGIHGIAPALVYLNRCGVHYASVGLEIEDCFSIEGRHVQIARSSSDGVRISGSSGLFNDLASGHNGDDNLDVTGSDLYFYYSSFTNSTNGNGALLGDNSAVLLSGCRSYNNRMCGVVAYSDVRLTIDSCEINENGMAAGDYWMGVYTYFNGSPVSLRRSRVYDQAEGLRAVWGSIFGYERHSDPVTWDNPDSLGRNCVYQNEYNLYGFYGVYEFAKTYYDKNVPHYQGGENSIFDPNSLQGSFEYSTAWLHRDWWKGNTLFNVSNSTVTTEDALTMDAAGCPVENRPGSELAASLAANWNSQAAALYRAWYAMPADSLKAMLYAQRTTLSALDAGTGFERVWRIADSATVEAYFLQVIANSIRPEILLPAYRYIAAARMRADDYSGAAQALLGMTQYTARGQRGYLSAQAMAAIAMHLGGSTASARVSLDTLLQVWPDDRDLILANWIIGRSTSPKRMAAQGEAERFALSEPWPNPSSLSSMIALTLSEAATVEVTVHDVLGREVRRLAAGLYPEGTTHLVFNSTGLPAGMYLVRMTAYGTTQSRMLRIVR